jgi:hypothetical protein
MLREVNIGEAFVKGQKWSATVGVIWYYGQLTSKFAP